MADERGDSAQETSPSPTWAFRIATIAGIPIRVHFTFLLFLVWYAFGNAGEATTLRMAYVLSVFLCILLHELGHGAVAMKYGIPVADITLYPIGGVARIEKQPKARQELWIALAGPAVNVVIAIALWAVLGFPAQSSVAGEMSNAANAASIRTLFERIMLTNVILVLFNMIPAFPMDGGRVLRAVLALNIGLRRATAAATGIGQFLAILAGFGAAFAHQWILMFVALFVFIGAGQEAFVYRQAALLHGVTVAKVMMTDVRTLAVGNTLKEAADLLLATSQHDFPVMHGDRVEGVLTRNGLLRALSEYDPTAYVAGIMERQFHSAGPAASLAQSMPDLQNGPLIVLEAGDGSRLLGMVTAEHVSEYFAVTRIAAARARGTQGDR